MATEIVTPKPATAQINGDDDIQRFSSPPLNQVSACDAVVAARL